MKETYLSRDFRETAAQCFPSQAKELNAFFDARLNVLLAENADASKEKQYHLQRQILPGVAAYETLQRVMPKEEALQPVHCYVEELARTSHKQLAALLHIPGLYRLVPGVFVKSTRSVFGPAAGFDSKELQVGNGIWRVDMMKCPYHIKWYFAKTDLNTDKGKAENKKSVVKYAKWYTPEKEAKYPTSFKVDFVGQPYEGACYYRITRCPICIYTEKLGVSELMPLFCELDEVMITLQHGVLHRKQTLANGGEYCDYFITGNRE